MIFLMFALLLYGIWYISNKYLGKRFEGYLKWTSLAVIIFFAIFDINMMIETWRYVEVQRIAPNGIVYTDPVTGVSTRMYGAGTEDSGTIMAYHYAEFAIWPIFTGLLPLVFTAIIGYICINVLKLWYDEYRGKNLKIIKGDKNEQK